MTSKKSNFLHRPAQIFRTAYLLAWLRNVRYGIEKKKENNFSAEQRKIEFNLRYSRNYIYRLIEIALVI